MGREKQKETVPCIYDDLQYDKVAEVAKIIQGPSRLFSTPKGLAVHLPDYYAVTLDLSNATIRCLPAQHDKIVKDPRLCADSSDEAIG